MSLPTPKQKVDAGQCYVWGKYQFGNDKPDDIIVEQIRDKFWIAYIMTEGWCAAGGNPDEAANEFKAMANILVPGKYTFE